MLPFRRGTPGGEIPLDLWTYPASVPLSDRELDGVDDFRRARRLITLAATGLK